MKFLNKQHNYFFLGIGIVLAVFVCLYCMSFLCSTSAYADNASAEIELSFSQELKLISGDSMDQVYDYKLMANNKKDPMPKDSVDGVCAFKIESDQITNLIINYSHAGIYTYKACMADVAEKQYYNFDKTQYLITVCVENADDGGLKSSAIYQNETTGDKVDIPCWIISYEVPAPQPEPEPEPVVNPIANIVKTLDLSYLLAFLAVVVLLSAITALYVDKKRSKTQVRNKKH